MTYIKLDGDSGPLCPYSMFGYPEEPHVQRHRKSVAIHNDVYEAFADRRDADGELSPENDALYGATILDRLQRELDFHGQDYFAFDRMNLYRESLSPWPGPLRSGEYVETWWLQCQGCGFVLPANRQEITR